MALQTEPHSTTHQSEPERTTSDRDAMMRFQMALEAISEMDVQVRQDAVAMKRVAKKALGTD